MTEKYIVMTEKYIALYINSSLPSNHFFPKCNCIFPDLWIMYLATLCHADTPIHSYVMRFFLSGLGDTTVNATAWRVVTALANGNLSYVGLISGDLLTRNTGDIPASNSTESEEMTFLCLRHFKTLMG